MAIILPLINAILSTPGVLPALALGFFILILAIYRYKIEKYVEEDESPSEPQKPSKEIDTEACQDCHCGKKEKGSCEDEDSNKIKKISILYGTTTGNSKDFAWKLAKEAEEEGFEYDVNNVANIDAEEFLPQEASNSK